MFKANPAEHPSGRWLDANYDLDDNGLMLIFIKISMIIMMMTNNIIIIINTDFLISMWCFLIELQSGDNSIQQSSNPYDHDHNYLDIIIMIMMIIVII